MSNSATECAIENCNCGVCKQCQGVELSSLAAVDAVTLGMKLVTAAGRTISVNDLVTFMGFEVNLSEFVIKNLTIADSPYTLLSGDDYLSCTGAVTINFPASPRARPINISAEGGTVTLSITPTNNGSTITSGNSYSLIPVTGGYRVI